MPFLNIIIQNLVLRKSLQIIEVVAAFGVLLDGIDKQPRDRIGDIFCPSHGVSDAGVGVLDLKRRCPGIALRDRMRQDGNAHAGGDCHI